jgi:hypothetical protein
MFGIFGKKKEISFEDIEETSEQLLSKFGQYQFCGLIDEKDFEEHDFYEIYDKNKNYEIGEYKKIYKDDIERTYINIVYEGYKLKNSVDEKDFEENIEDTEEYDKKTEDNKIKLVYIIAKEIYDEDELKLLEPYCECINCKNNKVRDVMPFYKKTVDKFILLLIRLVVFILGEWESYNITLYLKTFLNIYPVCSCCCGCIKSRHNTSAISVRCARERYFKDLYLLKNYGKENVIEYDIDVDIEYEEKINDDDDNNKDNEDNEDNEDNNDEESKDNNEDEQTIDKDNNERVKIKDI